MTLSLQSSRRRGGAVVRARQDAQTLEHPTQANVLLAFKLSMVSGNGVSAVPRPSYRSYRKMADIGVQYEPQDSQDSGFDCELPFVTSTSTVAEINTSAETGDVNSPSVPPHYHRPLSVESSSSSSSSIGEERERKKLSSDRDKVPELDVDAICVQQTALEECALDLDTAPTEAPERAETDGFHPPEKEEANCGLDCVYFTMQCCECTIL